VHVIAAPFDRTAIEPNGSFIRDVVPVGIAEFPNMRRGAYIDSTLVNQNTFRQRQFVGKHRRLIEDAVSVAINQSQHSMLGVFQLNRRFVRVSGAVRDVKHSIHIKAHVHRPLHQWWRGDTLQLISVWNRERVRRQLNGLSSMRSQANAKGGKGDQNRKSIVCEHGKSSNSHWFASLVLFHSLG
jgi:hypothetical protein